jgi:hypothetical protein
MFPINPRLSHDRECRVTFQLLRGLLLFLLLTPVVFGSLQKAKNNDAQAGSCSIAGTVRVVTGQGQESKLAGVTVTAASMDSLSM